MKKANFVITGEVFCIGETEDKKVRITLIVKKNKVVRVIVPRRCCNPKKWNVSDFIRVTGTIVEFEEGSESCEIYKAEFSSCVLKKLFTLNSVNDKTDFLGDFHLVGTLERITPIDEDNYVMLLSTDDGVYNIYADSYTLFHDIVKLDCTKKFRIQGKISIISYSRYEFEGVVSQINYVATNIDYI